MKQGKKFLSAELKNWKPAELIWLAIAVLTILSLSLYWKDSVIGILAAVTGVLCVVLTGKGKLSSYIFGFFNVLFYAYIAFQAKYYGEVMLNLLYYLPMNFVGWFAWKRHMDEQTGEVEKKRLSAKNCVLVFSLTALAILIYGWILKIMGGNLPFADSMSTIISIAAQILCVKRYVEQWVLWIVVDIVTVIMWTAAFFRGGESVATLIMWSIYLINAVIMFIKWYKEADNFNGADEKENANAV
ncbi:MAG: nicotinamide riboside transporter PnuC [Lachnospiraceae bacterium]|nr:nicotinamide riboside transporter PnuC [Lachnospiraceae bacterium]